MPCYGLHDAPGLSHRESSEADTGPALAPGTPMDEGQLAVTLGISTTHELDTYCVQSTGAYVIQQECHTLVQLGFIQIEIAI